MSHRLTALGLLSAWLLLPGCGGHGSRPAVRHLVVICLDTVRFDAFQVAHTATASEPHGRWVERALRLERTQSTAPWTIPAVASVLTGLHPTRHGAGVLPGEVPNLDRAIPAPIAPQIPTLAERLRGQGFDTAAFVTHPWFQAGHGLKRGFDAFTYDKRRAPLTEKVEMWLAHRAAEKASGRFFLYVHFMDSHRHFKWTPDERQARRAKLSEAARRAAVASAPGAVCEDAAAPSCTHYLAYVQSIVDQLDSVARLLDSLEHNALLPETLAILYSDHGEEFSDHEAEERAWRVDPRGIFGAGHGQSLFQELLHVPLWIWHPDVPGRQLEAPASLVDVAPTALEWLGVESGDADWDGRSLARWVAGDAPPPGAPRPLYSTRIAYGPEQAAVVRGSWKRVIRTATERELFDLSRDPREREPVQHPEIERELDALLASYGAHEPVEAAEPPALSEAQLEQLQSLGYLEGASPNAPPDAGDAPQ